VAEAIAVHAATEVARLAAALVDILEVTGVLGPFVEVTQDADVAGTLGTWNAGAVHALVCALLLLVDQV